MISRVFTPNAATVEAGRDFPTRARQARHERTDHSDGAAQISLDSPKWRAWAAFWRTTKTKGPPLDRKGGRRLPCRFPPAAEAAE
jgi:hypothetical protein